MDDTEIVSGGDHFEPPENETDTEEGTELEQDVEEGDGPDIEEPELPLQHAPQKQTANQRIQQEIAKRKALEAERAKDQEELAAYRRRLLESAGFTAQTSAPKPSQPDPGEMRRKLESMDDIERIMYMHQQSEQRLAAERQAMQHQMMYAQDKSEFNAYLAENPQYKRFAGDVEKEFQAYINKGQPRARDEILAIVIGREVRTKAQGAVSKATKAGAARIQQQTTKPASVRSGVTGTGSRTGMSPEEVLFGRLSRGEYSQ